MTDKHRKTLDRVTGIFLLIMFCAGASAIGYVFRSIGFADANIVVAYILAVILTARYTKGFIYGMLASVAATFAFNYFFTSPYFTFAVDNPAYLVTLTIMAIAAFIVSALTSRVKLNAVEALERETEAKALYCLISDLANATDEQSVAGIAVRTVSSNIGCHAECIWYSEGKMETYPKERECYEWPISGNGKRMGVLRMPAKAAHNISENQKRLLYSMLDSIGLAIGRLRAEQERMQSKEQAEQERYRGNLLRAISHDLRTPLAGIMGTSEMLMDMTKNQDPRFELAQGIYKDANWLHSLVENILSLTKLQEGRLTIHKQLEAIEEVIAGAISHMEKRWPEHEIMVRVPDELLLIPMDARLIQQVIINLLDNAVKHTPKGKEISISVVKDIAHDRAVIEVLDRGEGIDIQDLDNVFQMFYTSKTKHTDAKQGIGLGLPICEAIIHAHGGEIEVFNRKDGAGAGFSFWLSLNTEEKNNVQ